LKPPFSGAADGQNQMAMFDRDISVH